MPQSSIPQSCESIIQIVFSNQLINAFKYKDYVIAFKSVYYIDYISGSL